MASHSRVLAWRIPGTGEPGGLPSMGSHRVGHDWSDLAASHKSCSPTLVAQTGKRLSTTRGGGTRVWSLGWEDPLEKEMAIHFSTVAWKIPWTQYPGRLHFMGSQRIGHDWEYSHMKNTDRKAPLSIPENQKIWFLSKHINIKIRSLFKNQKMYNWKDKWIIFSGKKYSP